MVVDRIICQQLQSEGYLRKFDYSRNREPCNPLNGTWKLSLDPPKDFWLNQVDFQSWPEIGVPGECQMQGFPIKHDQPFVYKTSFQVPVDYENKKKLSIFTVYTAMHGVGLMANMCVTTMVDLQSGSVI